jgi:hypothetical protein
MPARSSAVTRFIGRAHDPVSDDVGLALLRVDGTADRKFAAGVTCRRAHECRTEREPT